MRVHINRSALLLPLSVFFLPLSIVPTFFDRNAAFNFLILSTISIFLFVWIFKAQSISITPLYLYLLIALVVGTGISVLTNEGKINMLTGDTGRYTGLVSLYSLLIIAISYSQVNFKSFNSHLNWIIAAILIVDIFGALQFLEVVKLPTGAGIGSTLGNSDFFSAWLGTSIPLFFAFTYPLKKIKIAFQAAAISFSIIMMWVIDVKQGFVDLIILIALLILWNFRHVLSALNWGIKFWTAAISFATIVWFELIFLLPMANIKIPFFIDDIQVRIRTHFWNAGMQMFFDHPLFGVGPDNYGNYYEKYRSLESFKLTEFVLSNDAHSSTVQTIATLGLINFLIFMALWVLLINAWVINIVKRPKSRNLFFAIGAYFLIFATNSMISPITLPNKFIFWALAGFVIGSAAQIQKLSIQGTKLKALKATTALMVTVIAFVSINFGLAQFNFIKALSDLKKNQKTVSYNYSPYLPCVIYFPAQADLAALNSGLPRAKIADQQIKNSERCLYAQIEVAKIAINQKDWRSAEIQINNLFEIAPARREVISIAAIYALNTNNEKLQKQLIAQSEFLGILGATGSVLQFQQGLK